MLYGNFDKRICGLKWIDIDNRHSQLILDNPSKEVIAELEYSIGIPSKCHWSSFNHVTRHNKDSGIPYNYDYLDERDKAKKAVIEDLIKECKIITKNTKWLMKKLQDMC